MPAHGSVAELALGHDRAAKSKQIPLTDPYWLSSALNRTSAHTKKPPGTQTAFCFRSLALLDSRWPAFDKRQQNGYLPPLALAAIQCLAAACCIRDAAHRGRWQQQSPEALLRPSSLARPLPILHIPGDGVTVTVRLNLARANVQTFVHKIHVIKVDQPRPGHTPYMPRPVLPSHWAFFQCSSGSSKLVARSAASKWASTFGFL